MNVYIDNENDESWAILRIIEALKRYAPKEVNFVPELEADVIIIPVVGRLDALKRKTSAIKRRDKQYALIQLVLKSTLSPDPTDWWPLWHEAKLTWSYYDLRKHIKNFYHAPLGVDSEIFRPTEERRPFMICTSGQSYLTESVRECILAAKAFNGRVAHLGPYLNVGELVECFSGLEDQSVADVYNQCQFVSGLRRLEGFELPAAEGLMCGARPILFDQPHYRQWYDGLAEFIPETNRDGVVDSLRKLFAEGPRPITQEEYKIAKKRFDWNIIISGFWDQLWTH